MKKVKISLILIIFLIVLISIPKVNAQELNYEIDDSNSNGEETGTYSITDPNISVDDGGSGYLITFSFEGATYNNEIVDSYSEIYGLDSYIDEPDSELFRNDFEEYTLKNWALENGEVWDFENDVVTGNITLYSVWKHTV